MKTKLTLFVRGSLLLMSALVLPAQTTNANASTNSLPLNHTLKYQVALEQDRNLGEWALLPPGIKEKLKLTDAQRLELKPIENDFAKTAREYQAANQPRLVLTPDQIVILETPDNQWSESHGSAANDPSAN